MIYEKLPEAKQGAVWFIEIYSTMENSSQGC